MWLIDQTTKLVRIRAPHKQGVSRSLCPPHESCTQCYGPNVVDLADLLYSPGFDYFRCRGCGCWWKVSKDAAAGPAKPIIIGNAITPNSPAHSKAS